MPKNNTTVAPEPSREADTFRGHACEHGAQLTATCDDCYRYPAPEPPRDRASPMPGALRIIGYDHNLNPLYGTEPEPAPEPTSAAEEPPADRWALPRTSTPRV